MTRLEARLALLAAQGETITYGELARETGLRIGELTARLERLMEADAMAGRPFRAAVCASRLSGDCLPARGFFEKAEALGRPAPDPMGFALSERAKLRVNQA